MTASTRIVTLSRVMVSWPGTAAAVICMLTLRSRSVNGLTQVSPGSRRPGRARPQRKTTPRSYWRMILNPNIPAIHPRRARPGALTTPGTAPARLPAPEILRPHVHHHTNQAPSRRPAAGERLGGPGAVAGAGRHWRWGAAGGRVRAVAGRGLGVPRAGRGGASMPHRFPALIAAPARGAAGLLESWVR